MYKHKGNENFNSFFHFCSYICTVNKNNLTLEITIIKCKQIKKKNVALFRTYVILPAPANHHHWL